MLVLSDLRLSFTAGEDALLAAVAAVCRVDRGAVQSVRLLKRSLDARKKSDICFLMQAAVMLSKKDEARVLARHDPRIKAFAELQEADVLPGNAPCRGRIVVAGLGPAGLFCAYTLALHGYAPLVIERGRPVEERALDVERFWSGASLDPESNVMFGEGGAGTFSDGKLTSRSKDPRGAAVLRILYAHGAPEEIAYLAKPHIGTDRLRLTVSSLRREIERLGGEVRFSTRLEGIVQEDGGLTRAVLLTGSVRTTEECAALVLAIGQGARDTYRMLLDAGVAMEGKPMAVGCRIEHPQGLINRGQFGDFAGDPRLGAAEYRLTGRSGQRGVYTFCMCPGGQVIASQSGLEQVVVNGMSNFSRDAENANAAVVVQTGIGDFGAGPLDGVRFCEEWERRAFLAGGGTQAAPASRVEDFLLHRTSGAFGSVHPSYRPGVERANLWTCLPDFVAQGIADGVTAFGRQLHGFDLPDAVLTAVETRTSAPVRIVRGADGQSASTRNLYPVGEGAGYAGGIISAAIDGMRAAEQIIGRFCTPVY